MNNRLKNLTKKSLKTKVTDGWATQRFLDEYEITREEFDAKILEIFPIERARSEIYRDLKQNDKRFERHKTAKNKNAKATQVETITTPEVAKFDTVEYQPDELSEKPKENDLESYKAKLAQLEIEIYSKTEEREQYVAVRKSLNADEDAELKKIEQLRKELSIHESKVESLRQSISESNSKISNVSAAIKKLNSEADEVKSKIRELSMVYVFVYQTGEISVENVENEEEYTIPDEWETVYESFSQSEGISDKLDECLESFTRKEMKVLAKVFALLKMLGDKDIPFEVTCDIKKMECAVGLF